MKYLDQNGLLYLWQKLKDIFAKKEELRKIEESIPKSSSDLADGQSLVKLDALTEKLNLKQDILSFYNPSSEETTEGVVKGDILKEAISKCILKDEFDEKIREKLSEIQNLKFSIVENLDGVGETNTIYLVSKEGADKDIFDEYIYINGSYEKIGSTAVNLDEYLKKTDIEVISNEDIDSLFN